MSGLSTAMAASQTTIRIRLVERSDLRQMLNIFSQAIPHAQLSRSIYLAPGAEAFLTRLLEHRFLQLHEQLWGVELDNEGLVAAAHTRPIGEAHHLNNYAVLPAFQGRGLGGRMMAHWNGLAEAHGARRLTLDVALENERARRHYAAFGFKGEARSHEYRLVDSRDLPEAAGVELQDWPLAQASFQAYGFGRFVLSLGAEHCSVDLRVGGFRLGSTEPRFLAALRAMDPARIIFVRTPDQLESPSWSQTGTIVRMTKELS